MAEGTAPEKTSFAKAWIRCAVADSDRDRVFASGDVRASPYGGGGDGFVWDAERVLRTGGRGRMRVIGRMKVVRGFKLSRAWCAL